jgi:predicted DCC family thiol-disulfide oxidoreductase YuxK
MASAEPHTPTVAPPDPLGLPERTVFFDGVCNFCDHSVQWLLKHDERQELRFAALQGETAERLRGQLAEFPDEIDTIVFVENLSGGPPTVSTHSRALFAIFAQLDASARLWRVFRFLPEWLLDAAYRSFGRSRYRLFGRRDTCSVPTPEQRTRFLP